MVMPMTLSPARFSMPATTELSTPPDIATAIVCSDIRRRQLSQTRHHLNHGIDQRVDLFLRIRPSQRKAHTRTRLFPRESDRRQYMRRLGSAARTSGAARYREALEIQRNQQRLAVDSIETNVRSVANARHVHAVDVRPRHARQNSLLQTISQHGLPGRLGGALCDNPLRRASEARCTSHVLCTRPHLALVWTAIHQRPYIHALANVECA